MSDQSKTILDLQTLQFYLSPVHDCSYIDTQQAITLFADPTASLNNDQYALLSKLGFRRSGEHIYRPHCTNCNDCIPVRIPVSMFTPSRSQKRILKLNSNISVIKKSSDFNEEHYNLYRRYISARHAGGGMDDNDVKSYKSFICSSWSDTYLYEFRRDSTLIAVAVTDHFSNSLSAVYTFFDPELKKLSLGVFSILWQINHAIKNNLSWVYLGYWITECQKMAYKVNYRPIEYFDSASWKTLDND